MPWFDKVLQKDSKSVEEKIGNRMKALNEKTLQKEKNEEFKKKISSQMNAIERKTTSTKRDECNANRRRRLAESDDSDDVMLPSVGGEEDYDRSRKNNGGYNYGQFLSKNDQFGAPGEGGGFGRPNDRSNVGGFGRSGQHTCSHSGAPPKPYMSLHFIDLCLPRK